MTEILRHFTPFELKSAGGGEITLECKTSIEEGIRRVRLVPVLGTSTIGSIRFNYNDGVVNNLELSQTGCKYSVLDDQCIVEINFAWPIK